MKNKQYKISITTNIHFVDELSSLLWDLDTTGVQVEESLDESIEYDYIDSELLKDCGDTAIVSGFFDTDITDKIVEKLKEFENNSQLNVGSLEIDTTEVDPDLWIEQYKLYFKAHDYGNVVVIPEWETTQFNKPTVKLQLASAFGTGYHETTSMCICALQKYVYNGAKVADIGCGSGILGLVALSLGAGFVSFGDIDSQAVEATQYNLSLNNINIDRYKLSKVSFLNGDSMQYNIIVANLTASLLTTLADELTKNTFNGSIGDSLVRLDSDMHTTIDVCESTILIISGIILDKLNSVRQVYLKNGWQLIEENIQGEWGALVMRRHDN
ncbi:MAG: 50S ribosomal protein L11 methyltransferase [Firmicutes bacterium]|nr:50S ribosomal protein L11 methyltransferase [Bacillota bacterium]MCL1953227.1 50S ribosomal protein L11 methyltransferase [Bacillota bacterium]